MSIPSPDRRQADVLVVGEALIDVIHSADRAVAEHVGGSPANVALGTARLGRSVRLHTALARDTHGERIAAHLSSAGVLVDSASWTLARTSTSRAVIGIDGAASYTFDIDWSLAQMPRWRGERVVHVGSISMFLEPGAGRIANFVRHLGSQVLLTVDPNIRPALIGPRAPAVQVFENLIARASVVKLSDEDAAWLYPEWPAEQIADRLHSLGASIVVVTRGGDGAVGFVDGRGLEVDAPLVKVADTVGAGDTFSAALIDGLLAREIGTDMREVDVSDMLRHAVAAASVTVQRAGADLPTARDVVQAKRRIAMHDALTSLGPLG